MKRWQFYLIVAGLVGFLAAFAYFYGVAITMILIVCILTYVLCMRSFKTIKRLIVESQAVLGENDRKLLKRIQSIEDRLDG